MSRGRTVGTRSRSGAPHRRLGWQLVAAGGTLLLAYCALVWFDVFGHNDDAPVCFGLPHRDWFFPPATVCSPEQGRTAIATSTLTTTAGVVLFLLAVGLLVTGLVLVVRSRSAGRRAPRSAPARLHRPVPGTSWSPGARSLPVPPGSRSLTPTAEPSDHRVSTGGARR